MLKLNKAPHSALVGGYDLLGEFADYDRILNGGFDADTNWIKGTGWTIAAGVASCDGSQPATSNIYQTNRLTLEKKFRITFTVSNRSAGGIKPFCGSGTPGTLQSADGTYTEELICATDTFLYMNADVNFIGDIDNVSAQELYTPDYSGRANHGTVVGATATPWGYSFNGSSDYIEVFDNADMDMGDGDFTIMVLAKTPAVSAIETMVGNNWAGSTGMYIRFESNGKVTFTARDGGGGIEKTTVSTFDDDIAHWFIGEKSSNVGTFYVDGIAQSMTGTDGQATLNPNQSWAIGALMGLSSTPSGFFGGIIQKVLVFRGVALTQREIIEQMRPRRNLILMTT